jgi:hypothetical protein
MTKAEEIDLVDTMGETLKGTHVCRKCADKDMIITGLKSMNDALAGLLDRLRAERKTTPSG